MIPIFGELAESGQLPTEFAGVATPDCFEVPEQKVASLIISLAQESWTTDRTNSLIGLVQDAVRHKTPNEVYGRIIHTLRANRSSGPWFEEFLIELGKLLVTDSYELKKNYVGLLRNALRRRTSKFGDATMRSSFNLPAGITEVGVE